jgi:hypothetical protein
MVRALWDDFGKGRSTAIAAADTVAVEGAIVVLESLVLWSILVVVAFIMDDGGGRPSNVAAVYASKPEFSAT